MKNYIFFMHFESVVYFVLRLLFFFFFSYTHHPSLRLSLPPQWNRPTLCRRHHRSPPLSLSLPSFSFFPSLSTSPREKVVAMMENQGWREEGATGCHWPRQPTILAVIDNNGDGSTNVGRDIKEGWVGIPDYGGGSMVGSIVYPQKGSLGCVPFKGDKPFKSRSSPTTVLLLDRKGIPNSSLFFNSCLFVGNLI